METKTYFELIEIIEGQRSIINKQASAIIDLLNQCAEQENLINVLMKDYIVDDFPLSDSDSSISRGLPPAFGWW